MYHDTSIFENIELGSSEVNVNISDKGGDITAAKSPFLLVLGVLTAITVTIAITYFITKHNMDRKRFAQ